MISKKYSLQDAFKKRLLLDGEDVSIKLLYIPYKTILQKTNDSRLIPLSLKDYFGEDNLRGRIYNRQSGHIEVMLRREVSRYKERAELVASKLLSDDTYSIKATYTCNSYQEVFSIVMGPNIIVRFEGEDESPVLELPECTAYTVN